jgi:hypothetical protein
MSTSLDLDEEFAGAAELCGDHLDRFDADQVPSDRIQPPPSTPTLLPTG